MSEFKIFHSLKLAAVAALGMPVLAFAPLPEARAQTYYGAITYSEATRTHGFSYDYSTRAGAESRAVNECENVSGRGDCYVLVWFRNACGALAESYDKRAYGSGWGSDRAVAEQYALQSCSQYGSGCSVTRWVCTTR
ncbi:MAG: DUF4189 domain-containing protein [Cyanobacteria bacterium P01_E01_bin.45]